MIELYRVHRNVDCPDSNSTTDGRRSTKGDPLPRYVGDCSAKSRRCTGSHVLRRIRFAVLFILSVSLLSCSESSTNRPLSPADSTLFRRAANNGKQANEGYRRCRRFVAGWLAHADPVSGLIPRNLDRDTDLWNAQDAAADNYPFMVLTAALTDRPLFEGRMLDMLRSETRLTSRVGTLPDTYSFSKQDFRDDTPDLGRILFGASEYIKDGLLPLTEWLGPSPWSERMLTMLDDLWDQAPVETPYGSIVSDNVEVNGEMLQTLARVYWMTGESRYLDWAIRLGDYYLLGDQHPTRHRFSLRLRDHGCEIVSGLTELYATVHYALPEKKQEYHAPLHEMLDRILEVGRNELGLFYNIVNPQTGEIINEGIADNFGYTLNGFYTVYLIDGTEAYKEATLRALETLEKNYRSYRWEGESADGYADAIEGALNLFARESVVSTAAWLDSEIRVMWAKQQDDGVIEGWHGDGNFARTTIMYNLWKAQGTFIRPWREDVELGAVRDGEALFICLSAGEDWQGTLRFDAPRHRTVLNLPLDWPRINQFPEWYTVAVEKTYELKNVGTGGSENYTGAELTAGIPLNLAAGSALWLKVE